MLDAGLSRFSTDNGSPRFPVRAAWFVQRRVLTGYRSLNLRRHGCLPLRQPCRSYSSRSKTCMKGGSPFLVKPRQRSNHVVTQAADRRRRELRLIGSSHQPRMSDAGGNSRPSAPAVYDQRQREFGDGRLSGRAHWQAALFRPCGMVRPVTPKSD